MNTVTLRKRREGLPTDIRVTGREITVSVTTMAYLEAIVEEVGNPSMLLTKSQLLRALEKAAKKVEADLEAAI